MISGVKIQPIQRSARQRMPELTLPYDSCKPILIKLNAFKTWNRS